MIQRFSTAKTMWHARRSFLITAITDVAWMVALFIVGLAMVAYLKVAGELPVWVRGDYDRIFPYVMASIFPVGATGLVLAGILAASLSSVDSAINALTTIGMVDFYQRLHLKRTAADIQESPEEQRRNVRLSRILTVVIGATGIVLACFVGNLGSLFDFLSKVLGTFTGVMLAIFWLGMFTRRATGASAIAGAVAGVVIASAMSFHLWLPVGAIWIGPVSVAVTMIVGVLLGSSQPSEAALQWNWFAIVGRDWVDEAADSQATWQSPQLS
jgi:Na+/proline symporter